MFLSFVVPVYNSSKYLQECLTSLVNQNFAENDYEIVCINDGSSDDSPFILQSFAKDYTNMRIINKSNQGVSAARNDGIAAAQGDYIWFVDSDDFISENSLIHICQFSVSNADVIQFCTYSFGTTLTETEEELYHSGNALRKEYANQFFVTRNVYRRRFILENKIFFIEGMKTCEDIVFNSVVFSKEPKITNVDKVLYYYRQHPSSTCATLSVYDSHLRFDVYLKAFYAIKDSYSKANSHYSKRLTAISLMEVQKWAAFFVCSLPHKEFRKFTNSMIFNGLLKITPPPEYDITKILLSKNLKKDIIDYVMRNSYQIHYYYILRLMRKIYNCKKIKW